MKTYRMSNILNETEAFALLVETVMNRLNYEKGCGPLENWERGFESRSM